MKSTSRKKAFESIRLTEEVLKWLKQKKKPFLFDLDSSDMVYEIKRQGMKIV